MDRREFMKSVGTAGLAGLALTGLGQTLANATTSGPAMATQAAALGATGQTPHELPPLPYDYNALEP